MQYMALIYTVEGPHDAEMGAAYGQYTQEIMAKGQFVSGDALQPAATATSIRVRNGKTETTDGPFAETKEQLGGYYILECADLDEAIACAAKIPGAKKGTIELRPVMVM